MYSFTGHLLTAALIHNYRKSVPVSHQHQTSCSEMRTQETVQLRTVINAYIPITTMNFEAKISIDTFSANLIRLCNNVSVIIQPNF